MKKVCQSGNWSDDDIPYICWDRRWTVGDIRKRLQVHDSDERFRVLAWLMRELKTSEVWSFVTPKEVYVNFSEIKPWLGASKDFWEYILGTWHELGKI